jgi:hypothetical protein
MREAIEIGYQAFVSDGGEEFGAVRAVSPNGRPELVMYVENAGDFVVPLSAVEAVHSQKVILSCGKLEPRLRHAIGHAHDAEEPTPDLCVGDLPGRVEAPKALPALRRNGAVGFSGVALGRAQKLIGIYMFRHHKPRLAGYELGGSA